MIYVDVTSACLLPLQSGIPRTTRGVYRLLVEHGTGTMPIFWQPFRGSYTELSSRARKLLDDPFADRDSTKTPRDSNSASLVGQFFRSAGTVAEGCAADEPVAHRRYAFADLNFSPDNRLGYLQRLVSGPGLKVAIFHDAIPLRDPNVAAWEKKRHVMTLRLLAQMDRVIAVSDATRRELQELWVEHGIIAQASIIAILWPVSFTGPRPEFSEPPSGRKRLLYVSRLKQVKNHLTLFDACQLLWNRGIDFELELIGCEDEASESRAITKAALQLREDGRPVSLRGHVNEEELHAALPARDLHGVSIFGGGIRTANHRKFLAWTARYLRRPGSGG